MSITGCVLLLLLLQFFSLSQHWRNLWWMTTKWPLGTSILHMGQTRMAPTTQSRWQTANKKTMFESGGLKNLDLSSCEDSQSISNGHPFLYIYIFFGEREYDQSTPVSDTCDLRTSSFSIFFSNNKKYIYIYMSKITCWTCKWEDPIVGINGC